MFKKVVLADNISVFVDEVYRSPQIFGSGTVALAVAAYAIQIYMDFPVIRIWQSAVQNVWAMNYR